LKVKNTPTFLFLHNNRAYNTTITSLNEAIEIAGSHHLLTKYKNRKVRESPSYIKVASKVFDRYVLKAVKNNAFVLIALLLGVVAVCILIVFFTVNSMFKEKTE
jgi:hypothetical protein